jgi:hypothetical protein
VTHHTSPVLDPVEDRLRRTFAARAEDMAPGDEDDMPLDLLLHRLPAPPRRRWTSRPLHAAAVVVLAAIVAAGVALVARGGDADDTGRLDTVGEQPSTEASVTAVTAPRALVVALQNERNQATSRLLGIEDAIALPVNDVIEARTATDAAILAFEALLDSPEQAAYDSGLVSLEGLEQLRRDIDADPGPRSLENIAASQRAFDRYAAMVDPLLNGQMALAEAIDDPTVRTGAVAYAQGMRLDEQTAQLSRSSLLAVVWPGTAEVSEASRLQLEVQQGLDRLLAQASGTPYEAAAAAVVADIDDAGLLAAIGAALDGSADVAALLSATDVVDGESWPAFLDDVEQVLAAQG